MLKFQKMKLHLNFCIFHLILEMWYQIFLWALGTSIFIHCVVALISFCTLRRHKYGRFFPILVIIVGFLFPVTGGVITSKCYQSK